MKEIILPGSEGEETSVLGSGGRLAADDVAILSQVAAWWRHRLTRGDAADAVRAAVSAGRPAQILVATYATEPGALMAGAQSAAGAVPVDHLVLDAEAPAAPAGS